MQLIAPAQEVPAVPPPWSRHILPSSQTSGEAALLRTVGVALGLSSAALTCCKGQGRPTGLQPAVVFPLNLFQRYMPCFLSCCITSHIDLGVSDNSIHHMPKPFQRATQVHQEAKWIRLRNNASRWMLWRQGSERDHLPLSPAFLCPAPQPPTPGLYFFDFDSDD